MNVKKAKQLEKMNPLEELCDIFDRAANDGPENITTIDYRRHVMCINDVTDLQFEEYMNFQSQLATNDPQLTPNALRASALLNRYAAVWALTDELSGLGNRRACREHLTHLHDSIDRSLQGGKYQPQRQSEKVAILALDLNKFKKINDTLGHDVGDEALRFVTEKLKELLPRATDTIFRPGGDEFIIILEQTDEDGAKFVIDKIRELFETLEFDHSGRKWPIGTSVGLQMLDTSLDLNTTKAVEANLKQADLDLYKDKVGANDEVANDNQIREQLPLQLVM